MRLPPSRLAVVSNRILLDMPGINIIFDAYFNKFRRPPSIAAIRETASTALIAVSLFLTVVMALPTQLSPSVLNSVLPPEPNTTMESTSFQSDRWTREKLLGQLFFYHLMAEAFLISSTMSFAMIHYTVGLASTELHEVISMHKAWWRVMRWVFLWGWICAILGITFTKLALTRGALLMILANDVPVSDLIYTWAGRVVCCTFVAVWFMIGLAHKGMRRSVLDTTSTKLAETCGGRKHENETEIVIDRQSIIKELRRYLDMAGGPDHVTPSGFENFLLVSYLRSSRRPSIALIKHKLPTQNLAPFTRRRALALLEEFLHKTLEDETKVDTDDLDALLKARWPVRRGSVAVPNGIGALRRAPVACGSVTLKAIQGAYKGLGEELGA